MGFAVLLPTAVLTWRLSGLRGDRRVTIDFDRREIIFEYYQVVPRLSLASVSDFLASLRPLPPMPRYVCTFGGVAAFEGPTRRTAPIGHGPQSVIVHVPAGWIRISAFSTNFDELCVALRHIAGERRVPLWRRRETQALIAIVLVMAAVSLPFVLGWLP